MSDDRTFTGVLTPDQLAMIGRVLVRVRQYTSDERDKEDRASIAMGLFQSGFTSEEQLLTALLGALTDHRSAGGRMTQPYFRPHP